jgi:hypothetical protein
LKKAGKNGKFLSEVVYHSEEAITHEELVELMANSVKEFWKSDIGIMYGSAATDGVKSGEISRGFIKLVKVASTWV